MNPPDNIFHGYRIDACLKIIITYMDQDQGAKHAKKVAKTCYQQIKKYPVFSGIVLKDVENKASYYTLARVRRPYALEKGSLSVRRIG